MTLKKRRFLLVVSVLIFIVAALVINFYVSGYRLDSGFNLVKTGGIYIYSPLNSSDIYLDNQFKKQTGFIQNGVFIQNLKPGTHSILVAKDGYWPWQKNIKVEEEMVSEVRAMLISQNPQGKVILKGPFLNLYASPYQRVLSLVENKKNFKKLGFYLPEEDIFMTPASYETQNLLVFEDISDIKWEDDAFIFLTEKGPVRVGLDLDNQTYEAKKIEDIKTMFENFESSKLENFNSNFARISKGKKEIIWWDAGQNTIWFEVSLKEKSLPHFLFNEKDIEFPVKVFQSRLPITNVDFFPGRRDIIIMAINNGVYALELDGRGGRMLQPIYKGKKPTFAAFPGDKKIYILDENKLFYVEL